MHILLRWGGGGWHVNKAKVKVKGQRSGYLIRRSSGAQSPEVSPEVEAGGRSRTCRDMSGEFPALWYQITGKYPALLCVYIKGQNERRASVDSQSVLLT